MSTDRRRFLKFMSAGAIASAIPASIKRALALPANHRTGTIQDVEHIVILMQENRSFDHYFGTLQGVRGFGDPRAVALPSGRSGLVPARKPGTPGPRAAVPPDARRISGCSSSRIWRTTGTTTHAAWNGGKYDAVGRRQGHHDDGVPDARATFRSTTRWPTRSPSATRTTARSWARPIRTAITCGPAGSATTARAAAR